MRLGIARIAAVALLVNGVAANAQQAAPVQAPASQAIATLETAAKEGKYTFLLFYKQSDDATKAMANTLKEGLANKSDQAIASYVEVGNAANQPLVARYDVSRAPMPMTIAVAPNGAMTGMFAQRLTPEKITESFVTPTMMKTMKNLQAGKLVLVTVQGSAKAPTPIAVKDFQSDPHFKDRLTTLDMSAADPLETKFLGQLQIDANVKGTQTVLLAPPGVMIGKFDVVATKDQIAGALANAGKCCDDPNCKHHQQATQAAPTRAARR